jgi:hypothetical protein
MQKLSNRKGLSTVITTLIILVVAVLLAGVVTYYATNVVMTRTTQEEVRIRKPHIWVQEGDNAYAAIMVQNLGGRDVLIDKITLRGVNVPWGGESEVIGTGAVVSGTLNKKPIIPGSIVITATVAGVPIVITDTLTAYPLGDFVGAALGVGPDTINYMTGDWDLTWAAPPDGDVTASYSVEGAVYVQFYRVQSGEDVSGDFELKEVAGEVFAQIGTVPVQGDWDPAISDMPLKSSGSMLFFIMNPTNIALHDVGTTISLTIYTSNAQWIVETIVQAAEIN